MPSREGPTLVTPDPYYVCNGCPYLKMIAPANWGSDSHKVVCKRRGMGKNPPIMWTQLPGSVHVRTPPWCPLLPKEEENGS